MRRSAARVAHLAALGIVALPTLIYVGALLFDPGRALVLWERGHVNLEQALPLALSLTAYAVLAMALWLRLPDAPTHAQRAAALTLACIGGAVLQTAALRVVETYPLRAIFLRQYSDFTGGYFTVGVRVDDLAQWLGRFAAEMESYNVHAERHPPGLPMLFWALRVIIGLFPNLAAQLAPTLRPLACFDLRPGELDDVQIAAGALGAVLESALAWLVPVVLFLFLRLAADERAAVLAALLYPLIPGALQWVSQWNRSFGLFGLVALILIERLVRGRHAEPQALALAALTGLTLSAAVWLSFGNAPQVMMAGLYALVRAVQTGDFARWNTWIKRLVAAGLAFAAPWLTAAGLTHFDPIATYRNAMQVHLALQRDYWPFVVWHAWDLFTFAGVPLSAIALLFTWRRAPALTAAWVVTLAAQCVLHVARGETGRVWMYFAPVIVGLAAWWLRAQPYPQAVGIAGLLIAQSFVHIALLRVISYGVDPLAAPVPTLPRDLIPVEVRFEPNGEVRLLGFRLTQTSFAPGESGLLELFWRHDGEGMLSPARKVFVHITEALEDKVRIAEHDAHPANWTLPTSCWLPGQLVYDPHPFTIDAHAPPGEYWVLVGLYDERTGERAFVHTAQVARYSAVALPVKISVR
ncbi:MAG: hypothetical protein RMJ86_01520 [Anaerolineae bacterium]|nr:hypothetical protein [Anaerolineae bacterium]